MFRLAKILRHRTQAGFTLVELIVVVGVIVILMGIVLVAINPARRFAETRNAERWSNVNAILNGVITYVADNNGSYPTSVDSDAATVQLIGAGTGIACADTSCTGKTLPAASCFSDLGTVLVDSYLASLPADPQVADGTIDTRYYVNKTTGGRIAVGSCDEEAVGGTTTQIEVSR